MTDIRQGKEEIHVLHVDDEPGYPSLIGGFLEQENSRLSIDSAEDADIALEKAMNREYDCIISDYAMPATNGLELLEILRNKEIEIPFILLTGKGNEEIAQDAKDAGVAGYVEKQYQTDQYAELAETIVLASEEPSK